MKMMPSSSQAAREVRVLGQEAVARMHGLGAGLAWQAAMILSIDQIGLARRRRADVDRFVGQLDVQRIAVGFGIDGDRRRCPSCGRS